MLSLKATHVPYFVKERREKIEGLCNRIGINQIIFSFNISNKIRIMFLYRNFLIA